MVHRVAPAVRVRYGSAHRRAARSRASTRADKPRGVGRDDNVARQHDLDTDGVGDAVHDGDHGLGRASLEGERVDLLLRDRLSVAVGPKDFGISRPAVVCSPAVQDRDPEVVVVPKVSDAWTVDHQLGVMAFFSRRCRARSRRRDRRRLPHIPSDRVPPRLMPRSRVPSRPRARAPTPPPRRRPPHRRPAPGGPRRSCDTASPRSDRSRRAR